MMLILMGYDNEYVSQVSNDSKGLEKPLSSSRTLISSSKLASHKEYKGLHDFGSQEKILSEF